MSFPRYSLLEDFELSGDWWLPGTPDRKVPGKLSYKAGRGAKVGMMDSLKAAASPNVMENPRSLHEHGIVLGITTEGSPCTLLNAIEQQRKYIFATGRSPTTLLVDTFYIGRHFASKEEIRFAAEIFEYAYLEEWLQTRPFQVGLDSQGQWASITVPRTDDDLARIELQDLHTTLSVRSVTEVSNGFREAGFRHTAKIVIQPWEEREDEWFRNVERNLCNFLTLCIGEATYPTHIVGRLKGSAADEFGERAVHIIINLLVPEERPRLKQEFIPAPYPAIRDKFACAVATWLSTADLLKPVHSLFFGTFYNRSQYVESEFLSLMQALEIFHRRKYDGCYLSEEDWRTYREALEKVLPDGLKQDHKESLKNRLRYGHQYSMRRRLKLLMATLSENIRSIIEDVDGRALDFSDRCVDIRNDLIHGGAATDHVNPQFLIWLAGLNRHLRALLAILLLKNVGFDEQIVAPPVLRGVPKVTGHIFGTRESKGGVVGNSR